MVPVSDCSRQEERPRRTDGRGRKVEETTETGEEKRDRKRGRQTLEFCPREARVVLGESERVRESRFGRSLHQMMSTVAIYAVHYCGRVLIRRNVITFCARILSSLSQFTPNCHNSSITLQFKNPNSNLILQINS